MRKLTLMLGLVVVAALTLVPMAFAAPPSTLPAVPVDAYANAMLTHIVAVATTVLPWAGAFTALAIGFAFLKGWIGRRKASSIAR